MRDHDRPYSPACEPIFSASNPGHALLVRYALESYRVSVARLRAWVILFDLCNQRHFGQQMDPSIPASAEYLPTQLQINTEGFGARRAESQRKAFLLRMAVVVLGASATLILGLKGNKLFLAHEDILQRGDPNLLFVGCFL
jgi:hypothetical protein